MLNIRRATLQDLGSITEIYNNVILNSVATFDTEPKTIKERKRWFVHHDVKHPILVADLDGFVVGWASLSNWSDRKAYAGTAEASLYVEEKHQGRGIGKKLLQALIQEGQKAGLHTVIARITEGNVVSISLFEHEGFQNIGVMKEVGRKFDRLLDVCMLQKIYDS